jgi:hypothetical protein
MYASEQFFILLCLTILSASSQNQLASGDQATVFFQGHSPGTLQFVQTKLGSAYKR